MSQESESNDTLATANTLSSGNAMNGQLSSSSDLDYYKLTVAAPGIVTVALDVPTNSTSPYFGLNFYNASGALQNSYTTGSDNTYRFAAAAAGTYYLQINAPSYYYSDGSYSFTATHAAQSVAGYEAESNNSQATANTLSSGNAMNGQTTSLTCAGWPWATPLKLDPALNSSDFPMQIT